MDADARYVYVDGEGSGKGGSVGVRAVGATK